jgi:nitrogen fixation NifU-like protein
MQYSKKVMDHFANPRNVGEIEDADGVGEVGNATCGDMMTFYIKVKDNVITDVKFKTFGCGAAIAVSSMVSEMAIGKTLEEVESFSRDDVAANLDGLPARKMHCSNLGTDALKKAIENFRNKVTVVPKDPDDVKAPDHADPCSCPYCGHENIPSDSECKPCRITLDVCSSCGKVINNREEHACS